MKPKPSVMLSSARWARLTTATPFAVTRKKRFAVFGIDQQVQRGIGKAIDTYRFRRKYAPRQAGAGSGEPKSCLQVSSCRT
jgi:hypothetical protein